MRRSLSIIILGIAILGPWIDLSAFRVADAVGSGPSTRLTLAEFDDLASSILSPRIDGDQASPATMILVGRVVAKTLYVSDQLLLDDGGEIARFAFSSGTGALAFAATMIEVEQMEVFGEDKVTDKVVEVVDPHPLWMLDGEVVDTRTSSGAHSFVSLPIGRRVAVVAVRNLDGRRSSVWGPAYGDRFAAVQTVVLPDGPGGTIKVPKPTDGRLERLSDIPEAVLERAPRWGLLPDEGWERPHATIDASENDVVTTLRAIVESSKR